MKKLLAGSIIMSCMLLLAGCGSTGNSEGGSKAGFNQKENADQE